MKKTINKSNLIHRQGRSPSRRGSVTLEGKQRTVLFSNTLVPLRYPNREGNKRGFTIVEVVIALTVIVIVSAAGMMMVQSQIKSEQKISQVIEATNIAENAIECFRFAVNNPSVEQEDGTYVNDTVGAFEETFAKTNYILVEEDGKYRVYEGGLIVEITVTITQAENKIDISAVNSNDETILEKYTYTKQ